MPRIFPVYLFTGDDDYLKEEAVQKLKKALLDKEGSKALNFNVYEIGRCDIKEVIATLRSTPFISEKRVVVLKNIDQATKETQGAIARYLDNPSKTACLVLESSRGELSGDFYRAIAKYTREISFMAPKGRGIIEWIKKEARKNGKIMRHDAALLLMELKKDGVNGLRSEIDKLVTYSGKRPNISADDVRETVGTSASRGVFEFINALGRKDAKESLAIANELFRTKKAIPEILGMIGWQFRKMKKARELIKKSPGARKKSKVPPFYIQRFMHEIKSHPAAELDRNIGYLLDADYSIKKGYLKPEEALELLIVRICSGK